MWNTCNSNFSNRCGCNSSCNRCCGCLNNCLFNLLFGGGSACQTVCRDCNGNLRVQRSCSGCGAQNACSSSWNSCARSSGCWNGNNGCANESATVSGCNGDVNVRVSCGRLGSSAQTTSENGDAYYNRQYGCTGRYIRSSCGCGCNE